MKVSKGLVLTLAVAGLLTACGDGKKNDVYNLHRLRIHAEASLKNKLVQESVSVQRRNRNQIEYREHGVDRQNVLKKII